MDEVVASVRLSVVQRDALRARAVAEHRTLSAEIRRLIERELADAERAEAA
jgi:hypothetical protein